MADERVKKVMFENPEFSERFVKKLRDIFDPQIVVKGVVHDGVVIRRRAWRVLDPTVAEQVGKEKQRFRLSDLAQSPHIDIQTYLNLVRWPPFNDPTIKSIEADLSDGDMLMLEVEP